MPLSLGDESGGFTRVVGGVVGGSASVAGVGACPAGEGVSVGAAEELVVAVVSEEGVA